MGFRCHSPVTDVSAGHAWVSDGVTGVTRVTASPEGPWEAPHAWGLSLRRYSAAVSRSAASADADRVSMGPAAFLESRTAATWGPRHSSTQFSPWSLRVLFRHWALSGMGNALARRALGLSPSCGILRADVLRWRAARGSGQRAESQPVPTGERLGRDPAGEGCTWVGAEWTDSGEPPEETSLNHREDHESRPVPCCPELTRDTA